MCRLKKALYGLKQASRASNEKIDSFFQKTSFSQLMGDSPLYIHSVDWLVIVIVIYADDLRIIGNHSHVIASTKQKLQREFEMTDLGLLYFFLGLEIW